jgi:hypothetical protein
MGQLSVKLEIKDATRAEVELLQGFNSERNRVTFRVGTSPQVVCERAEIGEEDAMEFGLWRDRAEKVHLLLLCNARSTVRLPKDVIKMVVKMLRESYGPMGTFWIEDGKSGPVFASDVAGKHNVRCKSTFSLPMLCSADGQSYTGVPPVMINRDVWHDVEIRGKSLELAVYIGETEVTQLQPGQKWRAFLRPKQVGQSLLVRVVEKKK